jgi:hypothetical protein
LGSAKRIVCGPCDITLIVRVGADGAKALTLVRRKAVMVKEDFMVEML